MEKDGSEDGERWGGGGIMETDRARMGSGGGGGGAVYRDGIAARMDSSNRGAGRSARTYRFAPFLAAPPGLVVTGPSPVCPPSIPALPELLWSLSELYDLTVTCVFRGGGAGRGGGGGGGGAERTRTRKLYFTRIVVKNLSNN